MNIKNLALKRINMTKITQKDSSHQNHKIESIAKWVSVFGTLAAVFIGLYQYRTTSEQEYKKPFYEERFQTYKEISETVSKIATSESDSKDRSEAVSRYWQLYFGKAQLIGDREVQTALHKMNEWIVVCVEKKRAPDPTLCNPQGGVGRALEFSASARNSLISTWNLSLEQLKETNLYDQKSAKL
jgi:hypothetical protein